MTGIEITIRMRSKRRTAARSTPSRPLAASAVRWLAASIMRRRMMRLMSLSSTSRTDSCRAADRMTAGAAPATRAGTGPGQLKLRQKVLPMPGALSSPTVPPISPANLRAIPSPRPVPPEARLYDGSSMAKSSKICP